MVNKKKNTTKKKPSINKILEEKKLDIKALNKQIDSLNEKNMKLLAEFDNFQRRSFNEKEASRKYQGIDIVKDLLPSLFQARSIIYQWFVIA